MKSFSNTQLSSLEWFGTSLRKFSWKFGMSVLIPSSMSPLLYTNIFLGALLLLTRGFKLISQTAPSWSLIPSTTLVIATEFGWDVNTRSKIFLPRSLILVGLETICSMLCSLQISNRSWHFEDSTAYGLDCVGSPINVAQVEVATHKYNSWPKSGVYLC